MRFFFIFTFFFVQNLSLLFVSLYQELLEPTQEALSECLKVLDNLHEVF